MHGPIPTNMTENSIFNCFTSRDDGFATHRYFTYLYNKPAQYHSIHATVNETELRDELIQRFKVEPMDCWQIHHSNLRTREEEQIKKLDFFFLKLREELLFTYSQESMRIYHSEQVTSEAIDEVLEIIRKHHKPEKPEFMFYMLAQGSYGNELEFREFKIKQREIDLFSHYNDDFIPVNEKIIHFLNTDDLTGLVLLHGKPGTGKTSYLRYLITRTKRKVIYIPLGIFDMLSSPGFLPFLAENTGCVWIIEDCEELVKSRESINGNSGISSLLNLSDGLLSDALNIKLICTFNTEIKNIDKALLRKGRLINRYEFKELSPEKTKTLLNLKGIEYQDQQGLTLAQIYNYTEEGDLVGEKRGMGFLKD